MPALEPQAALEQAVVDLLRSAAPAGLGLTAQFCGRTANGQPPPSMGQHYFSVWWDGSRQPGPTHTLNYDRYFGVFVTVTVRLVQPFDRWLAHRDWLEARVNDLVAAVHKDRYNFAVINAANTLADFRGSAVPDGVKVVGFCESLYWDGTDPIIEAGPDWLHAHLDQADVVAFAQRVRFAGARHLQSPATME